MTCYYPSRSRSLDEPCNASAPISHCCGNESACLDNGFCLNAGAPPYTISRGSCTDSSFESTACPQQCKDVDGRGISLAFVFKNGTIIGHCCWGVTETKSCTHATLGSYDPFLLPNGSIIWNRTKGSTQRLDEHETLATATIATSSPIPTVMATPPTVTIKDASYGIRAGSGVGVPLGVLLLVAIGVLCFLQRKVRSLQTQLLAKQDIQQSDTQSVHIKSASHQILDGTPVSELPGQPATSRSRQR